MSNESISSETPESPGRERPDAIRQLERMSEEMVFLLDRVLEQTPESGSARAWLLEEVAWWSEIDHPLLEAAERGFRARQKILRLAKSDGSWRNSISYIGDPTPEDSAVCTYEYDRAEVRLEKDSPWNRPYAWLSDMKVEVDAWYTRNGMSAITAWLATVSRITSEREQRYTILTNPLYYETDMLFGMMDFERIDFQCHDNIDDLIRAANQEPDR